MLWEKTRPGHRSLDNDVNSLQASVSAGTGLTLHTTIPACACLCHWCVITTLWSPVTSTATCSWLFSHICVTAGVSVVSVSVMSVWRVVPHSLFRHHCWAAQAPAPAWLSLAGPGHGSNPLPDMPSAWCLVPGLVPSCLCAPHYYSYYCCHYHMTTSSIHCANYSL